MIATICFISDTLCMISFLHQMGKSIRRWFVQIQSFNGCQIIKGRVFALCTLCSLRALSADHEHLIARMNNGWRSWRRLSHTGTAFRRKKKPFYKILKPFTLYSQPQENTENEYQKKYFNFEKKSLKTRITELHAAIYTCKKKNISEPCILNAHKGAVI